MKKELSVELLDYLALCGLSKKKIAQCTPDTRMYHDLGIYGELAEDSLYVLIDDYQVDMSGFEFDKYFPPDSFATSILTGLYFAFVPFAAAKERKRCKYLPLTLEMIEKVIQTKRWSSLTDS